jgi:RND superfamily putative drug exporter
MRQRADTTGGAAAEAGGLLQRLGNFVVRRPVVVIAVWVALAVAVILAFPPLPRMVREHPVPMMPPDAPAVIAARQMAEAFHESGSDNLMLVVLTNENGLRPGDEDVYRALVDKLRQDPDDVVMFQDFLSAPPLREVMTSKDHKAWFLPIGLAGGLATPQAYAAYTRVAEIVKQTAAGSTLAVNLTGPAVTIADATDVGDRDMHVIEIATAMLVLVILLLVYRNPVTMLLPLITIGISLMTAQRIVAELARLGLGVSQPTIVFMTAMMAGAGTDYAVFLISRYHDYLRRDVSSDQAVQAALASIGKVIIASAATVAVTFLCMMFAKLGMLSTSGPALAISICVAFLAAMTLLPAILVLAGRRGWVAPRRDLTTRFWRRSGMRIVRRPGAHLFASLIVLAVLACCGSLVRFNWDQSKTLPDSVESNRGYAALGRHFPLNSTIPQYLLIQSPHDMRTPRSLADLEQMALRVSQLPDIAMVRGITRPSGHPPEQASVAYQAGEVGSKLQDASTVITDSSSDLDRLANGAKNLADTLGNVRQRVGQAISSASSVVDALNDPRIQNSRVLLQQLAHDGTLDEISQLAEQLPSTPETQSIESTVHGLRGTLNSATAGLQSLGFGDPGSARAQLGAMQQGADALAAGSQQLSDGVQHLVSETKRIGAGLREASAFLLALKHDASNPAMAGFYIPPEVLSGDDFKKAATIFVSPDGHAVRYLIQTALNPFSIKAMDQVNSIIDTAREAQPNTALADASISMAGFPAANGDLRAYYNHDLQFIIIATILVVLLILIALLRALIAPIYLIFSVAISYMSALGIGVIVFQFMLGRELSWSIPGMAFIVLVAVGADYNMLLISEIRDASSQHGLRAGVVRTVASTGGVITSAGIIFAASMFGLLFGGLLGLVQAGFIIGAGLLLDTFLVRTITVPALAVLVGQANWWPILWGRPRPHSLSIEQAEIAPAPEGDSTSSEPVRRVDRSVRRVFVNELGGVTFQLDGADVRECFKVSATDLADEVRRAALYAAVPQEPGVDGDRACPHTNGFIGASAAHPCWLAQPNPAEQEFDAGRHRQEDAVPAAIRHSD